MYGLQWGPIEDQLIKQSKMARIPLPEAILNKPELELGLEIYFRAFFDLDTERSHAFGPQAIPVTSMIQYANALRFSDEQTENLIYYLRRMDSENLKRVAREQKQKDKAKK